MSGDLRAHKEGDTKLIETTRTTAHFFMRLFLVAILTPKSCFSFLYCLFSIRCLYPLRVSNTKEKQLHLLTLLFDLKGQLSSHPHARERELVCLFVCLVS